jgi:hypothetical protein
MKSKAQKNRRDTSRLDAALFFLILMWLAATMLLVLLRHPGTTPGSAQHPAPSPQDVVASVAPQAARASLMY